MAAKTPPAIATADPSEKSEKKKHQRIYPKVAIGSNTQSSF